MIDRVLHIAVDVKEEQIPVIIDVVDDITIPLDVAIQEGVGGGRLPYYEGEYEITPRKIEQILETKNTSMSNDVTVFAIPYAEVGNLGGGLTATIGIE